MVAPIKKLNPVQRAKIMMTLLALVLTGLGLIAFVLIVGWMVRRRARIRRGPSQVTPKDLAAGPLLPPGSIEPPGGWNPRDQDEL